MLKKVHLNSIILGGALIIILTYLGIATPLPQLRAFQSSLPITDSPTSQPPYFQASLPTPSPTPLPTIPPDLPHAERAVLFIAQRERIPQDRLLLADAFTIEFPLTHQAVWQGLVLALQDGGPVLYEVLVDENTREILTGNSIDPKTYWKAEETAFRERYASQILSLTVQKQKMSASDLVIAAGILRHYALTGQTVWQGKIQDPMRGDIYEIALSMQGELENAEALQKAEDLARQSRYGKLERPLYYYLQTRPPEEKTRVLLWVGGVDYEWVSEKLARRYPQVKAYRFASGQPVDKQGSPIPIDRELFDRIRQNYNNLLDQAHLKAAEPVVAFLEAKGYEANALSAFPGIEVELPVKVILELNHAPLENLAAIYQGGEGTVIPELDSVGGTIRVSAAWDSGYTGQGVRIGMIDLGIVNPNVTHRALQGKVVAANSNDPTSWHAALVAGVMIGDHPNFPQYRGIAYGSDQLVSTGGGIGSSSINFLVDQDAFVINASISTTSTRVMQWEDRMFDYLVRLRDPTIAVAAGAGGGNVKSPGKAYNVITVGAFDDHNDPHWHNDTMWAGSAHIDPYIDGQTIAGDREKPEVVAIGVNVTTVDINRGNDGFWSQTGTSVATPQVSALAALLIHRYWFIRTNPEAIKAIIMASAIHNIEGDTRLSDEDGAGAIDVASALSVFHSGGWGYKIIHDITDPNDSSNPFDGSSTSYDFRGTDFVIGGTYAEAGERIRAVICWDSNPASDYSSNPLSTDLDLLVISPSETVTYSTSWHNNYEIVDFVAPESGEYRMRVKYHARTPAEGLDLGLGLAWLRIHRVYLPLVMRNH